jgi:hypothetical protein
VERAEARRGIGLVWPKKAGAVKMATQEPRLTIAAAMTQIAPKTSGGAAGNTGNQGVELKCCSDVKNQ